MRTWVENIRTQGIGTGLEQIRTILQMSDNYNSTHVAWLWELKPKSSPYEKFFLLRFNIYFWFHDVVVIGYEFVKLVIVEIILFSENIAARELHGVDCFWMFDHLWTPVACSSNCMQQMT